MDWLPSNYSVESYISACLKLLQEWKWLTEEKNTDILKVKLLDNPPASDVISFISDLTYEELNEVPFGYLKDFWPDKIKHFLRECCLLRLNLPLHKEENRINFDHNLFRKMSPKKREEVAQLSTVTAEACDKNNIKHVIDFGSGLGYVDRILTLHYGLSVLGLEKDPEKVKKAQEIGGGVNYRTAYLSEETIPSVKELIVNWLQGSPACFIALHGCGDLSIHIANLFGETQEGKVLILVPCCYHRSTLRPLCPEVKASGLVNTYLLRLASDGTAERWRMSSCEQHLAHARSVLARALVELFPSNDSLEIKKNQRHLLRSVSKEDWDRCLDKCIAGFSGVDTRRMCEEWKQNEWRLKQIESYSCLQVCLQAVAEGLVLSDTYLFLSTATKAEVNLMRLFDVVMSPRSVAFILMR